MNRKDIVKIDNEEVILNSQKEFSEFKRRYNKYDFMQEKQINTWKTKLKGPGPDIVPEPTVGEEIKVIKVILSKILERLDRQDEFNKMVLKVFELNNLKME